MTRNDSGDKRVVTKSTFVNASGGLQSYILDSYRFAYNKNFAAEHVFDVLKAHCKESI